MPHSIEPASSGRAKCRACKKAIKKGEFRLGEEVENPFGEGTATHWYHLSCGALRRPDAFLDAWDRCGDDVLGSEGAPTKDVVRAWRTDAEVAQVHYRLTRFVRVQEAPSGRARCQGCRELIEKGALRFVLERIEDGMVSGAGFVHLGCAHAYAGAVDGILDRVRLQSELDEATWSEVESALTRQAELPRKTEPAPRSP